MELRIGTAAHFRAIRIVMKCFFRDEQIEIRVFLRAVYASFGDLEVELVPSLQM